VSSPPRWLAALCLASLLWSFSFGVSAPLASRWLQDHGFSKTVIGLNTGVYYLGIALAANLVPLAMRRRAHLGLFLGMIASAVTAAVFPFGGGLTAWFVIRALNGMAGALSLIPLETYVNQHSPPDRRAQTFGYYAFCVALGMALGTLAGLQLYPIKPRLAFLLGGAAALFGGVVVWLWLPRSWAPPEEKHGKAPLEFLRNFLGFGSAWSQGFLEGAMIGLLPIYLLAVGLSDDDTSWLMSGLMIGVILAQVPLAWLADRFGRTRVLVTCYLLTLVGMGCLFCAHGYWWLASWLFVAAACSGAFYPLGLALLGEKLPTSSLARGNAWYLAINCLGSLTGPVVAGWSMDSFGRDAVFLAGGGAVGLVLALWIALATWQRRQTGQLGEREPYRQAA
jgi:MFS family permease